MSVQRMAELARLSPDAFHRRYWHHRRAYDSGAVSGSDYWQRVIGADSLTPARHETIDALKTADSRSWTDYREDVWSLAADFRARGGRTALLSNGVPEVMQRVAAERRLDDYFDVVVVSYEVGWTKPDPRIYRHCLDRLGVSAESALFVDDRLENIEGAAREGIQTLHFTGDASIEALRSRLSARSIL